MLFYKKERFINHSILVNDNSIKVNEHDWKKYKESVIIFIKRHKLNHGFLGNRVMRKIQYFYRREEK